MLFAIRYFLSILLITSICSSAHAEKFVDIDFMIISENWHTVKADYKEFYSKERLLRMGMSFGTGAILANTNTDESFQKWYQTDIRSHSTNDLSEISKNFGNWNYLLPITLGTAIADNFISNKQYKSTLGRWGSRSVRAYFLGTPLLWISQPLTGASRPEENNGSSWQPFNDANGVSGHSFVGAVPFLTIAKMYDDNKYLKYFFYAASTLTTISRINDDAHYLSQAALGWYLAWEATDAVSDREKEKKFWINPMSVNDGFGINIGMEW